MKPTTTKKSSEDFKEGDDLRVVIEYEEDLGSDFDEAEERLLAIYELIINYEKTKLFLVK